MLNIETILLITTSFLFWSAILLRLCDTSAYVFLNQGIPVNHLVIKNTDIKRQLKITTSKVFKKKLKLSLFQKQLHNFCWIAFLISSLVLFLFKV